METTTVENIEEFPWVLSPEIKAIIIVGVAVLVILLMLCPTACCRGFRCGYSCCKNHRQHVYELEEIEKGLAAIDPKPTAPSDSDKEDGYYRKNLKDYK